MTCGRRSIRRTAVPQETAGDAGPLHARDRRLGTVPNPQGVVEVAALLILPPLFNREVLPVALRLLKIVTGRERS